MESTSDRPLFVVDASVATKWHLMDEPWTDKAEAILLDFRNGRVELVAPGCIRYEVPGAIRKTLRTRRLSADVARASIQAFLNIQLPIIDGDDIILAAYELTVNIGCSLYDGMYLALAEGLGCPLILADLSLRNSLERHAIASIWLDDWPV